MTCMNGVEVEFAADRIASGIEKGNRQRENLADEVSRIRLENEQLRSELEKLRQDCEQYRREQTDYNLNADDTVKHNLRISIFVSVFCSVLSWALGKFF